jgi:F0F1-type ATP synthase membrane subunit b/b'
MGWLTRALLLCCSFTFSALALAATEPHEASDAHQAPAQHRADSPAHGEGHGEGHGDAHGEGHGDAHGEGHGDGHGDEHVPTFHDINWFYGFLGEKEGEEPSLLWRPEGMPVPFGALLLNAGILYFLLVRFGAQPVLNGLRQRKLAIMKGMEDAAAMRARAEKRLADYEQKLADIDQEVARIRREMKETGEAERARILREAKERRERMERDARTLIDQELKAAREVLLRDTVREAVKAAEEALRARINETDQQRLADEYLSAIRTSGSALRGRL